MTDFVEEQDTLLREETVAGPVADSWPDEEIIDQVLRLVANQHQTMGAAIGRRAFSPTIAELRQTPLGRDLRLLAGAAHDEVSPDAIHSAATRVKDLLLRPLSADTYETPAWFWDSGLGQMLARAERLAYGRGGLLTVSEAARYLSVAPGKIEEWIATGLLPSMPDATGRPQISRVVIEHRREVASLLATTAIEAPERLAS
jgi:excisionase family DNA binding protein